MKSRRKEPLSLSNVFKTRVLHLLNKIMHNAFKPTLPECHFFLDLEIIKIKFKTNKMQTRSCWLSTIAIRCIIGVTVNRECLLQILILEFVVYFSSRKYHLIVLIENIFYNSNFQSKNKKILKNKAKSQLNKDTNN